MAYILAVDDDVLVLETLERVLRLESFEYQLAHSGFEALELIQQRPPDLMILDIIMPLMDGIEVCKEIRKDPALRLLPILFLTAKGGSDDIVQGLDAGGDDYVVKPFELVELLARIRALLRRTEQSEKERFPEVLQVGDVRILASSFQVFIDKTAVQLTSTQYRLMTYMMRRANETIPLGDFLVDVWDYPPGVGDQDLVRSHMRNLRAKIEIKEDHKYILTIHSVGYMFVAHMNS